MRTYTEINERIRAGEAVILTAEEVIDVVRDKGVKRATEEVDVVTTGTFGAMCSSGAFLNFGHSEPPIRMQKAWLNDVPAYTGIASVDAYIGATEMADLDGAPYGGAHVIESLIAGEAVNLQALSAGTDCYPRKEIETSITLDALNQAYLYNPRNAYQNYSVATNSSNQTVFTYMGKLLPNYRNATFSTAGELSPLLNDPRMRTVGIGTRIFLGGGVGYVSWEGTQFRTTNETVNGVPVGGSRTIAVTGDMKGMSTEFVRALEFHRYGVSLAIGLGIPIPILDEDMMKSVSISNEDIMAPVFDYSMHTRDKKPLAQVSYAELRSGNIDLFGKRVRTSSTTSMPKSRLVAQQLKEWMEDGEFQLTELVAPMPSERGMLPLNVRSPKEVV